uniref:Mce/MlaD domain-containing protein n=1 Tax=Riquetophycus sp. TaxID=1897556 RepID=A0A1C9C864_9FLOR|nr:hypothetical protein Riqu_082 [Riquetophycus sp.]
MKKIRSRNIWLNMINISVFLIFIFFTFFMWLLINENRISHGYSFFIEFSNAHGIKQGTNIRIRGVNIGYIKKIKIDINSVLVLAYVYSPKTLIPRNSVVETNQTGLLNETIIDIIPLDQVNITKLNNINVFSSTCSISSLVCHLDYLEGDRGLNYDDLVRAATRISQRFDDPSFFNIFYLFLQNSLELSDDIIGVTSEVLNTINLLYNFIVAFLDKA